MTETGFSDETADRIGNQVRMWEATHSWSLVKVAELDFSLMVCI